MTKKKNNSYQNLEDLLDSKRKFTFSEKQKKIIDTTLSSNTNVVFINGVAGTGKTYCAIYCALKELVRGFKDGILYIRTLAESGKLKLGARPGDVAEKTQHLMTPLRDKIDEIVSQTITDKFLAKGNGAIQAIPINDIRGSNWINKIVIVDEAQNYESDELLTVITRLGENPKIIFIGDSMQADIKNSGWIEFLNTFDDEESELNGIFNFRFSSEDIVRNPFLKFVISKIEKVKNGKSLAKQPKNGEQLTLNDETGAYWTA
jgi:phosphate starvation-inducible protein PhoH